MNKKIGINQIKFSKGKKIYSKGDAAHFAYYVHSGKVNIYSPGGLLLGKIGEGEIFGEVGRVIGSPRTVTAKAKTDCILYEIEWAKLQKKLDEADPVLVAISRGLSLRIGDANDLAEKLWLELSVYKSLE